MNQQIGAKGPGEATFRHRLEIVEDLRVGEILRQKLGQLRLAEGLEILGEAKPHHFRIVAADDGQQLLRLAAKGIVTIKQAGDGAVDNIGNLRNGTRFQMTAAGLFYPCGQRLHLCLGQHRDGNLQRRAGPRKSQRLPGDLIA